MNILNFQDLRNICFEAEIIYGVLNNVFIKGQKLARPLTAPLNGGIKSQQEIMHNFKAFELWISDFSRRVYECDE